MPVKKDLAEFSSLARAGAASFRNVVNVPELSAWLEAIATERLGSAGLAISGAGLTKESKAREWLAKVARKHQLREGLCEEVGLSEASVPSSWSGLAWVRKALAEGRTLSRLRLPHEEREKIASVLDWMRSGDGPSASGDWTRISLEQAVKAENDWIEAKAKAFAKRKVDKEAGKGTTLFLDLSSIGGKWARWRWVRVESALGLDREGALMKHCVGSYAKDVAEGRKEIYSLRDPEDKPKLTVEAQGLKLAQLKGFSNGACPAELREAAGAFAREFEKVVDPAGLGLVELSEDVVEAGFASLPEVGVFQRESGFSPQQSARWEGRLLELAKGERSDVECVGLVCLLAKMGMARELGELLPFLDPKAKHSVALSLASEGGHKEIVEMLLPLSDPKALDSGALCLAVRYGHKEIVQMLLPWSDALARDSQALCSAARYGHKEIVAMLLPLSDAKADDSNALRYAAAYGDKEIVAMLLPWSDALARDSQALCSAARYGHKEIVEMLLPLSDPLARESEALRWAAGAGHKEIVEMLLPLSDPLARDSWALREAASASHKDIVEMLLPLSDALAGNSQALCEAARGGHKEIVEMLLPVSDPLAGDSLALRLAASNGHKEIVRMLLPLSNPLTRDSQALCSAARHGHKEIVAMLLPLSDPLAMDSYALKSAAGHGYKEIVQMLAPCYWGDEVTFHRILKAEKMESIGFNFSTPRATCAVEPMSEKVAQRVVERRRNSLPQEIASALTVHAHGA